MNRQANCFGKDFWVAGDCPGGRLREGRCVRLKKGALAMRKDALGNVQAL